MSITLTDSQEVDSIATTTSISVNLNANLHDLIVVALSFNDAGGSTSVSVSDTNNGAYSVAIAVYDVPTTVQQFVGLYYFANNGVAGNQTITLTLGATRPYFGATAASFGGVKQSSPLDKTAHTEMNSTANPYCSPITPSVNGCLIFSYVQSNHSSVLASGGSFIFLSNAPDTAISDEYLVQGPLVSTGGYWTHVVDDWSVGVASFIPAVIPTFPSSSFTDRSRYGSKRMRMFRDTR